MPGKVIAQLMGHAKVDTTLNVYARLRPDIPSKTGGTNGCT